MRMLAAQAMYARDGTASWNGGAIALGRGLFRTVPEDIHDSQPIESANRHEVLVADLRLDNRDELALALGLPPHRAQSMADADILMAAWTRWGEDCLGRLVGDYAFALWDGARRRLVLARDPLGMRPLHYHRGASFFAFASMPKGLHALPDIPYAPDEERAAEFLALLPEYGSRTFFAGVEKVEAGHVVEVTANGLQARRHWIPQRQTLRLKSSGEYAEALRHHLDTAVRARLRGATERVAAHLSAGFDSSIVATSAARTLKPMGGKVVAFTAVPRPGYDGPVPRGRIGDEGPMAAKTAAAYDNIEHVPIAASGVSPLDNLERNFRLYDRPVLNLCNATWSDAIFDAARGRGLSVLLTGQFGNMTISCDGLTLLPSLIQRGRLPGWLREAGGLSRHKYLRLRAVLAHSFGPFLPSFLWQRVVALAGKNIRDVSGYSAINPERLRLLDMPARAKAQNLDLTYQPRKDGFEERLWVLRRIDLANYNKGALSGWGIDVRDPTGDRRLVEFSLGVPDDQFLRNGVPKALTRSAFADRLPPELLTLRGKGYQGADWHENLSSARDAVMEELGRLDNCGPAAAAIDLSRLRALMRDWPQAGWHTEATISEYRLALLRAVSTGHFLRRASRSNA